MLAPKTIRSVSPEWLAGQNLAFALPAAVIALSAAYAAIRLPTALSLPIASVAMLVAAGLAAAVAAWFGASRKGLRPTLWDAAGGLALLGFSAALLSDPGEVLPLLEAAPGRR